MFLITLKNELKSLYLCPKKNTYIIEINIMNHLVVIMD